MDDILTINVIEDEPSALIAFLRRFPAFYPGCDLRLNLLIESAGNILAGNSREDILVLDANLDEKNLGGFDALKKLADRGEHIPKHVLFTSGNASSAEACRDKTMASNLFPNVRFYASDKSILDQKEMLIPLIISLADEKLKSSGDLRAFFYDTLSPLSGKKVMGIVARVDDTQHVNGGHKRIETSEKFAEKGLPAF